jgi:lipid II:glycine glycyltransferase (peptidoglycan interpeptide bridge formation enzyme)
MHLPYISKRHGDSAIKMSYVDMKKSFENGELLQIKEGRNIVAGVIIDYKIMNDMPRITILGVLRGEFKYVKRGALIALYYYTIRYLKDKNHRKFNLGFTRPFFSDGVLQYKLNWGAKIVCKTSNAAFLLSVVSKKKCLKGFLSRNPFILKNRNHLSLATFSDQNVKGCPYLPKDENKIKHYGIDKVISFSF